MSASHEHALPTTGNERRLWIALGLTASFMIAEVVAGILTNSLTAHVVHDPSSTPEIVREAINAILADRFAVFHSTLQMESVPCRLADEMDSFTAPAKHVGGQAEGYA
jgi:Co/Zn/Cd efflux system component